MSRKRRNDEIDDDVVPAAPLTWFDVIPRDVCMEIATKMHPREFPLLVATGIVTLPSDVETNRSRRRIAYDIRLLKWLRTSAVSHFGMIRCYASCRGLVPSVRTRRMMCTLTIEANAEHIIDAQECVAATLLGAICHHENDIVQVCLPLEGMAAYEHIESGITMGELAVAYDNMPALKLVLAAGVDINARTSYGSLLAVAVDFGREEILRFLFTRGACIDGADQLLRRSLLLKNSTAIARMLIAHGADVNETLIGSGKPVLSRAIRYNADVARLLLAHGAKIGPFRVKGNDWSPLLDSVRADDQELSELLLALGADPSPLIHQYAVFGPPLIDEKHWDLLQPLIM